MREALRMFNSFLISGNTNIDEMFHKERKEQDDKYQISYHQLLKSIILGEYRFYKSERSHIANVFDFDQSLSDSHFNQLRILKYLHSMENTSTPIGRGYVSIDDIVKIADEVFISKKVIIDNLLRLVKFNLIAFDNQSNINIESASYVTLTHSGRIYLDKLIFQFIYLDCILIDTPISSKQTFRDLRSRVNDFDFYNRLTRTRDFVRYLVEMENEEYLRNPHYLQSIFSNFHFGTAIQYQFNKFVQSQFYSKRIENTENYYA